MHVVSWDVQRAVPIQLLGRPPVSSSSPRGAR
jgi:hypothetical protein